MIKWALCEFRPLSCRSIAQTGSRMANSARPCPDAERETLPNDVTEADLSNYIATINATISPFDLEFRSTLSQHDRSRIYALVNTTSDPITQLATIHSPDEIAYVKRVLDDMFTRKCTRRHEVFALRGMEAMQLSKVRNSRQSNVNNTTVVNSDDEGQPQPTQMTGQAQSISMHQAEALLDTLVAEGWFECSRKKYYSLAPRALMELRGWLIETYNDDADPEEGGDDDEEEAAGAHKVKFCSACRDIVTVGQRCPDLDCLGRLHDGCTRTMWRSQGGAERCPICRKAWDGFGHVGEKAELAQGRRSTGGAAAAAGPSNARSNGLQVDGGADENEEEDADEDAEGSEEG